MIRTTMICFLGSLMLLTGMPGGMAWPDQKKDKPKGKKLIEWGWDESDTQFMRKNIEQMEQFPFDGLVFHVISSKGGNLTWEIWGSRKFTQDEFQQAVDDLKATKFRRFTDRFLRVNVTPGKVDWFDDQAWATVQSNCGVASQVAKQGRCMGFMFDVEQYEGGLFDYRQQKHRDQKTFAEYQAKVRQRGQEWIKEANRHFTDITILLTFGYSITQPRGKAKDRSAASYGLLADFLDGMLDACSKETTLVDAWEQSYPYKEEKQFKQAADTIKKKALGWTAVPDKYRQHMKTGFGLWMDYNWRKKGWDVKDFSKNHFSPAEFEAAVRFALQVSDEYVWIYAEQPRWWTRDKLPQAYVEALIKARKLTPTGFELISLMSGTASPLRHLASSGVAPGAAKNHDPELQEVVEAWSALPQRDKDAILAIVRSCR